MYLLPGFEMCPCIVSSTASRPSPRNKLIMDTKTPVSQRASGTAEAISIISEKKKCLKHDAKEITIIVSHNWSADDER